MNDKRKNIIPINNIFIRLNTLKHHMRYKFLTKLNNLKIKLRFNLIQQNPLNKK